MVLPDKLDQLVVECMKELHNSVEQDYRKDMSNVSLLYEVPGLYRSYIKEGDFYEITTKYIDSNPLSLNQRKIFINLVKSFLS